MFPDFPIGLGDMLHYVLPQAIFNTKPLSFDCSSNVPSLLVLLEDRNVPRACASERQ